MKIKWSDNPDDDGFHDLCGKFNGKYVDIVQRYDGTWRILFNNVQIEADISTRSIAKDKITQFLENENN